MGGTTVAGGKMKATGDLTTGDGLWTSPNTGATNESGFIALPGGYRGSTFGPFSNNGQNGYWWSATENSDEYTWSRYLYYSSLDVSRPNYHKSHGFSIRCVKN